MKIVKKDVEHKKKVVGTVDCPVYENLNEAVEHEGEDKVLSLFNKQNHIRIQAAERQKHALGRTSNQKRFNVGFNLLTTDELRQWQGRYEELAVWMRTDPDMKRRIDAKCVELGMPVSDDSDESDDSDDSDEPDEPSDPVA